MAWFELVCGEIRDSLRGDRGLNCWKTGGIPILAHLHQNSRAMPKQPCLHTLGAGTKLFRH